jgi:hypothetical protein
MDLERVMRLKGAVEASAGVPTAAGGGQGLVDSYPRIRREVAEAVGAGYAEEVERLFPESLQTEGRPWGAQAEEVKALMAQMAGWLDGMIEAAILERRIQAEAEAKARKTGFA